ncbi:MAG: NADH-quinone oxidoreductase subunit F, partial [Clostridia bacterium]|nr:NADH-quinone oxidoreductase subunit F [Clostridia bacterium]
MISVKVGQGSCGISAGASKVYAALEQQIKDKNIDASLSVTGCIGMCYLEPIVDIYSDGELLRLVRVKDTDVDAIADYLSTGDVSFVNSLAVSDDDKHFLDSQTRIALRGCGIINPDEIEDYIANGGYTALKKALTEMSPEGVIEEIKVAGLACRGGAGFPTWFKWNAARSSQGEEKYLICNADEGDPGAFMDRAVIESNP